VLARLRRRWAWLDWSLRVTDRFGAVGGGPLSSSIALSAFLSLFPMLLVAIAVIGFLSSGDHSFAKDLIGNLGLEGRSAEVVTDAISTAEGSRKAASAIGLVGLAWSGLGVVGSLQAAVNAVWQQTGRGLADRAVAVLWLLGAVFLILANVALGTLLGLAPGWTAPLTVLVGLVMNTILFTWTYARLGHVEVPWRAHLRGAVLVAIGFEVLKTVGAIYVPRTVASSSALYGSIGVVFAVLAWLALYGRLFVYGAVVNVLRWEHDRGTDRITIDVPHQAGDTPILANRGGAVASRASRS
jgi:membrane protein